MGEKSVIVAQVHGDEHKYLKDENGNFKLDENGEKSTFQKIIYISSQCLQYVTLNTLIMIGNFQHMI